MSVQMMLIIYLIGINIWGFLIMGVDKRRARRHTWRIPESTLFLIALAGGSIGSILGMFLFHHKTRKLRFLAGMPAILIVQVALVVFLLFFAPFEFQIM